MGHHIKSAVAAAVILTALGSTALAGGFSIREQSAEGLGSAFAGIGAGTDGLSAMYWNPATISQHNAQGYISENNISGILAYSRAKNGAGFAGNPDSGNIGTGAIVPASYSVYGLTDEITVGMAISAPLGLSTDANRWQGSLHGDKSEIFSMNFNPVVAYKPADWITVAAGVQGQFFQVKLSSQTPAGGPILKSKADDIGVGFTAGLLLEPNDDLDIGIGFRSSISHKLKGKATYIGTTYDASAGFDSPEIVTLGIKYQVNDQWKLMGGVEWANWSRFKSLDLALSGGPTLTTVEKWKDSWYFSAGAEYDLNDKLTLRGGAAYEKSPVPDSTRTPRLPDNDRIWLSAGASYKINDWLTANIAYSHVFVKDGGVNLAASPLLPPLTANFKQHIDIASVSAVVDW
jgi:long-chain fatty acid transport protein